MKWSFVLIFVWLFGIRALFRLYSEARTPKVPRTWKRLWMDIAGWFYTKVKLRVSNSTRPSTITSNGGSKHGHVNSVGFGRLASFPCREDDVAVSGTVRRSGRRVEGRRGDDHTDHTDERWRDSDHTDERWRDSDHADERWRDSDHTDERWRDSDHADEQVDTQDKMTHTITKHIDLP